MVEDVLEETEEPEPVPESEVQEKNEDEYMEQKEKATLTYKGDAILTEVNC